MEEEGKGAARVEERATGARGATTSTPAFQTYQYPSCTVDRLHWEAWCRETHTGRDSIQGFLVSRWAPRVAPRLAPPPLVAPLLDRCHDCNMLQQEIINKFPCLGDCPHSSHVSDIVVKSAFSVATSQSRQTWPWAATSTARGPRRTMVRHQGGAPA